MYKTAVEPIIEEVLQGFNCTVFAYGQTGTGKTYTMEGDLNSETKQGMIPRAVCSIFEDLEVMTGGGRAEHSEFSAKVSFLELYNEELFDLLTDVPFGAQSTEYGSNSTKAQSVPTVRIVDDKSKQVCCQNLTEVLVSSSEDVLTLMSKALSRRQTAETKLNKHSSRSHCIFTLTVHIRERTPGGEDLVKVGKLNLVDLAGSESVGRAGGNDKRMREAGNINKSLLTLGRVITALVEKTPHIPYRDSKLTRLLQESLGGRAKTLVIATVGPSLQSLEETISTLDYASRAKSIKNKPKANKKLTKHELIKDYVEDMERMRKELEASRSKDGVWLSLEDHEGMNSTIEQQESEIKHLSDGIKQKEAAYEQKMEEISALKTALSQQKVANKKLETEKASLTTALLQKKYELEETCFILEEHKATEEKLQSQTTALKKVIQSCKRDIRTLEEKIDRQEEIEESNTKQVADHVTTSNTIVHELSRLHTSFAAKQQDDMSTLAQRISAISRSRLALYRSTVNEAKNLIGTGAKYQDKLNSELAHRITLVQENSESLKNAVQRSSAELEINSSELRRTTKATLDQLTRLITEFEMNAETELIRQVTDCSKQADERSATLKQDLETYTEAFVKTLTDQFEAQRELILQEESKLSEFSALEKQCLEGAKFKIKEQLGSLLDELVSDAEQRRTARLVELASTHNQVLSKVSVQENSVQDYQATINEKLEREVEDTRDSTDSLLGHLKSYQEHSGVMKDTVHHCSKELHQVVETFKTQSDRRRESMQGIVDSALSKNHEIVTGAEQVQTQTISELCGQLASTTETLQKSMQAASGEEEQDVSRQTLAIDGVNSRLESVVANTKSRCTDLQASVKNKLEEKWLRYDNTYRTGSTPTKKSYIFDDGAYRTDSETLLKERFRLGRDQELVPASLVQSDAGPSSIMSLKDIFQGNDDPASTTTLDESSETVGSVDAQPSKTSDVTEKQQTPLLEPCFVSSIPSLTRRQGKKDERRNAAWVDEKENLKFYSNQGRADSSQDDHQPSKAVPGQCRVDLAQLNLTQEQVETMKVKDLRKTLSLMSLSQVGKKEDLKHRVKTYLSNSQ